MYHHATSTYRGRRGFIASVQHLKLINLRVLRCLKLAASEWLRSHETSEMWLHTQEYGVLLMQAWPNGTQV